MLLHNDKLILTLNDRLRSQLHFVTSEMTNIPADSLNFQPDKSKWSALQCIEHLNLVFDWYLPKMKKKVSAQNIIKAKSYNTGFFGDRMVSSMEPKDGEIKFPMKTFRNMKPERSKRHTNEIVSQFMINMKEFEEVINKSKTYDLSKIRIKSAIGNILRFKLGDCFRFLVAHNERHLLQCKNVLRVLATHQ